MLAIAALALALAAPASPPFPGNGHRCLGSQFATGNILPTGATNKRDRVSYVVQIIALLIPGGQAVATPVGWIYVLDDREALIQFNSQMPRRYAREVKMNLPEAGYSGVRLLSPQAKLAGLKRFACRFAQRAGT